MCAALVRLESSERNFRDRPFGVPCAWPYGLQSRHVCLRAWVWPNGAGGSLELVVDIGNSRAETAMLKLESSEVSMGMAKWLVSGIAAPRPFPI